MNLLRLLPLLPVLFIGCAAGTQSGSDASIPRHLLWRVQSPTTTVYLLGSIHTLPPDAYPLDSALDRALDSSEVLALELELNDLAMGNVQQRMMTDAVIIGDSTLQEILSESTWKLLEKRLGEHGMDAIMFQKLEPWAVALVLTALEMAKEGMGTEHGVDMYFYQRAQKEGKEVVGLETVNQQIDIFDSMPMESQEVFLRQTLEDTDSASGSLRRLVDAWRRGDIRAIEELALKPMQEDTLFYRRFLVDRNYAWLPRVENFLSGSRRHLVVVGAAHLIGPDGLVAQLRKRGFRVEQL